MKKKISLICVLCAITILICACTTNKNNLQDDDNLNIVSSFYPMYIATANIVEGAENVTLDLLASPDVGCLHDYQLTVKDMMKLERADVFVINGGGMEAFLDKAVSSYPTLKVINASKNVLEEHMEENEETHEGEHHHDHGENSHVWVSVNLHIGQIEEIKEELKRIDPKNAEIYEQNANNYIKKLEELNIKMHESIDSLPKKNIVTFHEAFEFFAEEFNLNVVAVIEREPGTSPSAGDIARIIKEVKDKNANAIFVEPLYQKTAANTIANETGVKVYELDPVTSGTLEKNSYIKIMEKNLEVLEEALK